MPDRDSIPRLIVHELWRLERDARRRWLNSRLSRRNGALLYWVLSLADSNGNCDHAFNKRRLRDEVSDAFGVSPEMVCDLIKQLEGKEVGYLKTNNRGSSKRDKTVVVTEKARADLDRYADVTNIKKLIAAGVADRYTCDACHADGFSDRQDASAV
jgi:DNA-binding MarR family transcriptional regulator